MRQGTNINKSAVIGRNYRKQLNTITSTIIITTPFIRNALIVRLLPLLHHRAKCSLVCLAVQNFTSIGSAGGIWPPKYQKIPLFGKESPRVGEPLDRFLKVLGNFMCNIILQTIFKFEVIRFTAYGVIAEKPRVGHLGRFFPCTL